MSSRDDERPIRDADRKRLDELRTLGLTGRPSRAEQEILRTLDEGERLEAIAPATGDDPASEGTVAVTDRRLIYCAGRRYEFYVMRTAGTAIADLIASRMRIRRIITPGSIRSVTLETGLGGRIELAADRARLSVRAGSSADEFIEAVEALRRSNDEPA